MSMRDYSVSGYGIILNGLLDSDALDELAENDIISVQAEFTGEAFKMKDNGCEDWGVSESYEGDTLYFIEVPKYPRYFAAAYRDMDELVGSMKRRYDAVRKETIAYDRSLREAGDKSDLWKYILPAMTKTEIRNNLRSFTGTYYG